MIFAILLLVFAIVFTIFRALTPWATRYKNEVERRLSQMVGQPVSIHTMETGWYWFEPVLKLNQVTVSSAQQPALTLNKLLVGIDVFKSLWHWQIQPGILYIDKVQLTLRQVDDHWQVDGISDTQKDLSFKDASYPALLSWISLQHKLILHQVSIKVYLKDGTFIPFQDLNLTALNRHGRYHLKGTTKLGQTIPTQVSILADINLDPLHLDQAAGNIYISTQHFMPAQWQQFFPSTDYRIQKGIGNIEMWLGVAKGKIDHVQSQLNFDRFSWFDRNKARNHILEGLKANLAWKPTAEGWQLSGDEISFKAEGISWPSENEVMVNYNNTEKTYDVFVKELWLAPLLATDINWPKKMQFVVAAHPSGTLYNTQIKFKDEVPYHLLTRFINLGWKKNNYLPAVKKLSGILDWQAAEGRVELDAKDTIVSFSKLTPIILTQLNSAVNWKELDDHLQITMERLVLQNSDLDVRASAILQDPSGKDAHINATAEFSAQKLEQWLPYIPPNGAKPTLRAWLKNNIKRVEKSTGKLRIMGRLQDFPFDPEPGEFELSSHLTGVDLLFAENWPLNKNVEGDLTFTKRSMDANITHADIYGVLADNIQLRIDCVGCAKDVLVVKSKVKAPAKKVQAYINHSPLRSRLSFINTMDIEGSLGLLLDLKIPLPPENNVLVEGELTLDNNVVSLQHPIYAIKLEQVSGPLKFNESGIQDGNIQAMFWGAPLTIRAQSPKGSKANTQLQITGKTSVATLSQHLDIPLLSNMSGNFNAEGVISIPSRTDEISNLHLNTNLEGVVIDLPKPLGKEASEKKLLAFDLDFNAKNVTQIQFKYDRWLTATRLKTNEWGIQLNRPDILGDLRYQIEEHKLEAQMKYVHLDPRLLKEGEGKFSHLTPNQIPSIQLSVNELKVGERNLGSLVLKSSSSADTFHLNECLIQTPDYQCTIEGTWKKKDNQNQTKAQARLKIKNLAQSLQHWNIPPIMDARGGELQFQGGWDGGIQDFSLKRLQGEFYMRLKNGRIPNLSPETEKKLGLGKLLSILSLQTIPRRLQLDFSDLSYQGYSFDEFKGDFTIKNGVMHTDNCAIDGPVAQASMVGSLDLVKQLYNLDMKVSPHITASLPVVATIAGGPLAGVAAWVASKIINKGMEQISSYTYKVSGPWSEPVLEPTIIKKH